MNGPLKIRKATDGEENWYVVQDGFTRQIVASFWKREEAEAYVTANQHATVRLDSD